MVVRMLQCCPVGLINAIWTPGGLGWRGKGGLMMLDGRWVGWGLGG